MRQKEKTVAESSNNEPKTSKRRLKAPAATVREQAERAKAKAAVEPKTRRLKVASTQAKRPFAKAAKLFERQPLKFVALVVSIIGRIVVPRFMRNALGELRFVTWPGFRETWALTFATLVFAIILGGSVALLDYGLDKVFRAVIIK